MRRKNILVINLGINLTLKKEMEKDWTGLYAPYALFGKPLREVVTGPTEAAARDSGF